jgi:DNA polymerase-1
VKCLLDGDIYAFRAAASAENEEVWIARARVDEMINNTLDELGGDEYEIFLSGKDNFRYKVYPEYKQNRKDKPRPRWEQAVKQHLVDQWQATTVNGMEADDALGIAQCKAKEGTIISTIDKDLNQIPGWHYNFVKKEKYFVKPEDGRLTFLKQLLKGDSTDNIKGAAGIGEKKSDAILFQLEAGREIETVSEYFSCKEELELNAQCIYIWRKQDDYWRNLFKE